MAALAAAYRSLTPGSLLTPQTGSSLLEESEGFQFLPHTDPASFVEEFQNSSSVDNRLLLLVITYYLLMLIAELTPRSYAEESVLRLKSIVIHILTVTQIFAFKMYTNITPSS